MIPPARRERPPYDLAKPQVNRAFHPSVRRRCAAVTALGRRTPRPDGALRRHRIMYRHESIPAEGGRVRGAVSSRSRSTRRPPAPRPCPRPCSSRTARGPPATRAASPSPTAAPPPCRTGGSSSTCPPARPSATTGTPRSTHSGNHYVVLGASWNGASPRAPPPASAGSPPARAPAGLPAQRRAVRRPLAVPRRAAAEHPGQPARHPAGHHVHPLLERVQRQHAASPATRSGRQHRHRPDRDRHHDQLQHATPPPMVMSFGVRAVDAAGNRSPFAILGLGTPPDTVPPGPPTASHPARPDRRLLDGRLDRFPRRPVRRRLRGHPQRRRHRAAPTSPPTCRTARPTAPTSSPSARYDGACNFSTRAQIGIAVDPPPPPPPGS